jgi:hypothetical protein
MPSASILFDREVTRVRKENPYMPPLKILDKIRFENSTLWADFEKEASGGSSPTPKTEKARQVHACAVSGISAARRFQISMSEQMQKNGIGSHEAFHIVKMSDPELYKLYCAEVGYEDPEAQAQENDSAAA